MCSYIVYAPLAYKTINFCVMAQALSRRPFIAESRVRNQASQCRTRVSQNGAGTGFSRSATIFYFHYLSTIASFSLSLPFRHCFILIFHPSPIDTIWRQQLLASLCKVFEATRLILMSLNIRRVERWGTTSSYYVCTIGIFRKILKGKNTFFLN